MDMKKVGILFGALLCMVSAWADNSKDLRLLSPNGEQMVTFRQQQTTPGINEIYYQVDYKGQPVIENSRAGLEMDNRIWEMALGVRSLKQPACWMDNLEVDSVTTLPTVDKTWQPLYGERSVIRDAYNTAIMHLSKKDGSGYRLDIEVRAYNEGIAFRYFFPEHPKAIFHKVVGDLTEYTFPAGSKAWTEQWAQAFLSILTSMISSVPWNVP